MGDLLDLDTSLDENLSSNPIPEDSLSANLHIASSTPTRLSPNPFGDSGSVTNGHSTEISPQSLNMKSMDSGVLRKKISREIKNIRVPPHYDF